MSTTNLPTDVPPAIAPAITLVETNIQNDQKFPVVSELLHASASGEYEVAIPAEWQIITKQKLIPLPDALFKQYDLLECRCFMGLFPEIKRAWITVDHRLFLWNYEDESDFYSFDDQEQIIVSVALVRPKPGVFVDSIRHVLAVATPLEVFLLGVEYREAQVVGSGGDVTLFATQISIPADGVAMTSMVGTGEGRLFMSGNDGCLYEFSYQPNDGWLSRRSRKVNLTATLASYFIPTFLSAYKESPALSMAVDSQRQLLYVLSQDSSIKVYWLGQDGKEFILAHHHKSIANSAALLCPQFNEGTNAPFEIASMHVIPSHESRTFNFVIITSGGSRLYFSTIKRMQRFYESSSSLTGVQTQQPEVFEVVHVRLPPDARLPSTSFIRHPLHVHTAFYQNGTTLLANAWNEDHDSVVGAAPACAQILARISRQPRATLIEHASAAQVEGRTWAIAEINSSQNGLNDLVTVSSTPTHKFAVLTNAGVSILEKQRPVDMLRDLLAKPTLPDAQLREFIQTHGLDETCAISFTLLCVDEYNQQNTSMHVLGAARRILFEYGGVPHYAEPTNTTSTAAAAAADNKANQKVLMSGRHNGLAIYLSRTLESIWKRMATEPQPLSERQFGEVQNRIRIGISVSELVSVQERLRRLQHFINNNQRFVPDQLNQMPTTVSGNASAASAADVTKCWQAESQSLGSLFDLLVRSVEVISFLCLLDDFNLPTAVSDSLTDDQRRQLSGISFSHLVTTYDGQQMCRDLILALINSQLKQHVSIDSIADILSRRCRSLFSTSDVSLYKALECLKLAKETEEGSESSELATKALGLLTPIAGTLEGWQIRDIGGKFEALGQFSSVVTLSLACAQQSDPQEQALVFWGKDGAPDGDSREPLYRKRMECYRCVTDVLERRKSDVLTKEGGAKYLSALPQNDQLFLFVLYDWLLANDQSSVLFQMPGPHVEQYLLLEPRSLEKLDMLWHYYIHEGQYGRASMVQRELACGAGGEMNLPKRVEYLSLSITNGKIAIDMVRDNKESNEEEVVNEMSGLLRDSEDQLEIAGVQMEIQEQLRMRQDYGLKVSELDSRLFTVTELYDQFVEPLQMWESMLVLLKVSNHDDKTLVRDIWMTILRDVLEDQTRTGLMAVASKVTQLGKRLYPSATAFPLELVTQVLVELAGQRKQEYTRGYVADTLVNAKVPYEAVFETLNHVYSKMEAKDMLVREILALVKSWMKDRSNKEQTQVGMLPLTLVDEAMSQYIINCTLTNNLELKNELQQTQDDIRRLY